MSEMTIAKAARCILKTTSQRQVVDFWICEGRVCAGCGADSLRETLCHLAATLNNDVDSGLPCYQQPENENQPATTSLVRVLRGGCFGLCESAPNCVVRITPLFDGADVDDESNNNAVADFEKLLPNTQEDRLSLTHLPNEFIYGEVTSEIVTEIFAAHVQRGEPAFPFLRKEKTESSLTERLQTIRKKKT